jgi:site-specific recombinase XerD
MRCSCPLWVDGTLNGRRILRSLGTSNLEIAATEVLELEAGNKDVQEVSVDHAVHSFLKANQQLSSIHTYKQVLLPFQKFCLGKSISKIRAVTLPDLYSFKETWDCSALTAGKRIERLRTFFRFCEDNEWVAKNPATRLKKPQVKEPPVVPFTAKEWRALLAAIDRYPARNSFGYDNRARLRAFLLMLRYSGLRISDLTRLEKTRISKNGMLTLYTSKAGVQVRHPLPKMALRALKGIGNDRYYFWSGEGKLRSAVGDWQRSIRRLMNDAHVTGHPHMFRHTLAVELLNKGVTMEHVAAILGNSPEVCRKHYAPWESTRQKALELALKRVWKDA